MRCVLLSSYFAVRSNGGGYIPVPPLLQPPASTRPLGRRSALHVAHTTNQSRGIHHRKHPASCRASFFFVALSQPLRASKQQSPCFRFQLTRRQPDLSALHTIIRRWGKGALRAPVRRTPQIRKKVTRDRISTTPQGKPPAFVNNPG